MKNYREKNKPFSALKKLSRGKQQHNLKFLFFILKFLRKTKNFAKDFNGRYADQQHICERKNASSDEHVPYGPWRGGDHNHHGGRDGHPRRPPLHRQRRRGVHRCSPLVLMARTERSRRRRGRPSHEDGLRTHPRRRRRVLAHAVQCHCKNGHRRRGDSLYHLPDAPALGGRRDRQGVAADHRDHHAHRFFHRRHFQRHLRLHCGWLCASTSDAPPPPPS